MFKVLIEGCRAVGKTTLCNNLIAQGVVSFYRERFELNADFPPPETKEEFEAQQRWYIDREIPFWESLDARTDGIGLVIASPETLDFYTRKYADAYGKNWALGPETLERLDALSRYGSDLVIYLTAQDDTIIRRMQQDEKKRPAFWDYFNRWQTLNQNYYTGRSHVVFIDTTHLSAQQVCAAVMQQLRVRRVI
jgi:adenylate kinase family enzyme